MKYFRTLEEKKMDRQYDITRMMQLREVISQKKSIINKAESQLREAEEEHSRLVMKLAGDL